MKQKLIQQGAEAKIYLSSNSNGKQVIQKQRISKSYRHQTLDKQIRIRRTRSESKLIAKAHKLKINVPKILNVDKFDIELEFIDGEKLSETLNSYNEKKQFKVMQKLGEQVALLHKNNIIHGDLTTSNTILKKDKIYIIDFGLGFISAKLEDKAVDLHLIKQALEAKHFRNHENLFTNFLKKYKFQDSNKVIERLKAVEKRGRYKH